MSTLNLVGSQRAGGRFELTFKHGEETFKAYLDANRLLVPGAVSVRAREAVKNWEIDEMEQVDGLRTALRNEPGSSGRTNPT
jgi:hypothetical protein